MCGIAGIVNFDKTPVTRGILETMTKALAHRGPDGWGIEIRNEVGLGHHRLAIIDPNGGKQPMSNENGQIWVTFNGEIYNYRELRYELQTRGHVFGTNSDTETIVHAYEEWGDRCVERFRGMFAFGLLDLSQRRLFLARDHLGIKPLYYLYQPRYFAFASELQALRCIPDLPLDIDLQAIDQYLWLQYIPPPRTAFQQIKKLSPAQRLSVSFDGRVLGPEEYWQLQFRPDYRRSEEEWLEATDEVLRDSVRAHLVSDVPFGAFLSGGVDSSAVVAYMSQILDQPVRTFSIGFDEAEFSEIEYANEVAKQWKTEHHIEIVKPNSLEILPRLVKHYGEPFGDSSAIPTFYVSEMARRFVPMVLSGDGGDELFAGYDSYLAWMTCMSQSDLSAIQRLAFSLIRTMMPNRYPHRKPTLDNWLRYINYMDLQQRQALWRPEYRTLCQKPLDTFEREFAKTKGYSLCSTVQHMDIKTYLPNDLLTKIDVASMMHGLEVRTPLVDIRVVEFAATIPEAMNANRNSGGEWQGKLLLKKVVGRYYQPEFLQRHKMGFSVPISKWFAPNGTLHKVVCDILLGTDSTLSEFFEPSAIASLIERNATGPLWLLLFLEEWLRQNRHSASW